MPKKKYTKEKIRDIIKNIADSKNTTKLSGKDIYPHIPESTLCYYFGNLKNAFEYSGVDLIDSQKYLKPNVSIKDDELFLSLLAVEKKLNKFPSLNEYNALGKYSTKPFINRFGKWSDTKKYYNKWKIENENIISSNGYEISDDISQRDEAATSYIRNYNNGDKKQSLYGAPINFRGLRHAPINEQGVVFLFGMVSRELGFYIEAIQQGYPDCEGKYLFDSKKKLWAAAKIEFEYKASSFITHGHDKNKCDIIVCWENDWKDCPIHVIELKSEIEKLPSK